MGLEAKLREARDLLDELSRQSVDLVDEIPPTLDGLVLSHDLHSAVQRAAADWGQSQEAATGTVQELDSYLQGLFDSANPNRTFQGDSKSSPRTVGGEPVLEGAALEPPLRHGMRSDTSGTRRLKVLGAAAGALKAVSAAEETLSGLVGGAAKLGSGLSIVVTGLSTGPAGLLLVPKGLQQTVQGGREVTVAGKRLYDAAVPRLARKRAQLLERVRRSQVPWLASEVVQTET